MSLINDSPKREEEFSVGTLRRSNTQTKENKQDYLVAIEQIDRVVGLTASILLKNRMNKAINNNSFCSKGRVRK